MRLRKNILYVEDHLRLQYRREDIVVRGLFSLLLLKKLVKQIKDLGGLATKSKQFKVVSEELHCDCERRPEALRMSR
ncbi:hypothetical protein GJAV_G00186590 [Gymnothorax javanicus]|nr:hypothetical protein GJAV_G00186590 [Gymnothorax javanicus]